MLHRTWGSHFAIIAVVTIGTLALLTGVLAQNNDKAATRPRFGAMLTNLVLIADVLPDSAAAKAGLKKGDIVTAFDGKRPADAAELAQMISASPTGNKPRIEIFRNGVKQVVEAELEGVSTAAPAQSPSAKETRKAAPGGSAPRIKSTNNEAAFNEFLNTIGKIGSDAPASRINPAEGTLFITAIQSRVDVAYGKVNKLPIGTSFYVGRNGEIAYLERTRFLYNVAILNANFNSAQPVVSGVNCTPADIPVLSPDGTKVAVQTAGVSLGTSVYSRNGTLLTKFAGMKPTDWMPGGRLLMVGFPIPQPGIYLAAPDLSSVQQIGRQQADCASASPDGKRIAYEDGRNICVMDADGSHVITPYVGLVAQKPAWSPDGKWLAVSSLGAEAGTYGDHWAAFLLDPNKNLQQKLTPLKQADGSPINTSTGKIQWR